MLRKVGDKDAKKYESLHTYQSIVICIIEAATKEVVQYQAMLTWKYQN